jgi:hypothetical protein
MTRGRLGRPFLTGVVLVACAALLATSCSHSDVQYVSNESGGLFLKLPDTWGTFDARNGNVKGDGVTSMPGVWEVVFDGSAAPRRSNFEEAAPEAPVGFVQIVPVALFSDPTGLNSQAGLRSLLGVGDPLALADSDPDFELIDYKEFEQANGYYGNQVVATFRETSEIASDSTGGSADGTSDGTGDGTSDGSATTVKGPPNTVVQLAYTDNSFARVYVLRIRCTPECFDKYKTEIDAIVDSWTLRNS